MLVVANLFMQIFNMKKFIYDIILLSLSCVCLWIAILVFCKYGHMFYDAEDYPNYRFVFQEAKEGKNEYRTIILGDSRMMTFVNPVYFIYPDSAINFSLPGGSPIEAYYVLKNYIKSGRMPRQVIIGFDPGHYSGTQILKQGIPFDVFSKLELEEIANHLKTDSLLGVNADDVYSYYYGYLPKYGYRLLNSFFIGNFKKNHRIEMDVAKNKGCKIYGSKQTDWWNNETEKTLMSQLWTKSHFTELKICDYYFKGLLLICKRNNIQIIVEQLPIPIDHPIYNKKYWNDYFSYMASFKHNGKIQIITHLKTYPDTLFRDVMHANEKGTKRYSIELSKKWNL